MLLDSLRQTAIETLESCAYTAQIRFAEGTRGVALHVPSGDMKYGSFWIRDAAMMAETGMIASGELLGWLQLVAALGQNGEQERRLQNGLIVPPYSIADHINFDGGAVYYPGAAGSGDDQGDGRFGILPPHDDQFYFIDMARQYYDQTKDISFLNLSINGLTLWERLERAFAAPLADEETQLSVTREGRHCVDWGFCDTIWKSGFLLFPSLLRYRAALALVTLAQAGGRNGDGYRRAADILRASILRTFDDGSGWLLSATGDCRQHDIWGTAFAVYLGVPGQEQAQSMSRVLANVLDDPETVHEGYIRHLPKGEPWQKYVPGFPGYQNGGYWSTPTGWAAYAVSLTDRNRGLRLLEELAAHTGRYRAQASPFEWKDRGNTVFEGRRYGASAALPYAAAVRILSQ